MKTDHHVQHASRPRPGLMELWTAESLRRLTAEVPYTPDYRRERLELVRQARAARLAPQACSPRAGG